MNKLLILILIILSCFYNLKSFTYSKDLQDISQKRNVNNVRFFNGINIDKITKAGVEADTTVSNNKISNLYANQQDNYTVKIELQSYDNEIELVVYNILGKKVKDIYRGSPKSKDYEYNFQTYDLPDGVYICVLLGKDYRNSRKFIISR